MLKEKRLQIENCLKNIAKGDISYVDNLYDLVQSNLYFIALKYLKDEQKAEDLLSDFWCDIVKYSKKYIFTLNAYSYLCKIVTNMALIRLRKDNVILKNNVQLTVEFIDKYEDIKFDAADEEIKRELSLCLKKGFTLLSKEEKLIIYLTYWEEKTIRECAKEMGVSKSTAGRLKAAAIDKLKAILMAEGWDKTGL